jgi:polysaccharide pyruvyl transferase WcaK-like protein
VNAPQISAAPTRIVVTGAYSVGNLGDVALLQRTVDLLLGIFPSDHVAIYCPELPYLRRLLPSVRFVDPRRTSVLRGDLLVYGGGTQFFSFPLTDATLLSQARRALRSPIAAYRHLLRRAFGWKFRSTAALGIGIGPFVPGSPAEERARSTFRRMGFVAVRDPVSLDFCRNSGVPEALLGSDLCFAGGFLPEVSPGPAKRGGQPSIAAIVRSWPHSREGAAYVEPLLEAARGWTAEGSDVTFVSFCAQTDRPLIDRLRDAGHAVDVWDPERDPPVAFIERLRAYDALLTARYHGAIFAALLGKPCVCIEVEQKLSLAAAMLGLDAYAWRQPFTVDGLRATVSRLAAEQADASLRLGKVVARQRALAEAMLDAFTTFAAPGRRVGTSTSGA